MSAQLAGQLASARLATAKYATNLGAAERDGYQIITTMMPGMGYHYLNPGIQGFDVAKPSILVYAKAPGAPAGAGSYQLVALEWVFPEQPATREGVREDQP